jgi:hypothetical protein
MQRYQPAAPRVIAGFAAVAMTIATLSLSILAPSAVRTEQQNVNVATSALQEDHAFANAGSLVTSIDVVAYRRTHLVPVVHKHMPLRHDLAS